MTSTFGDALGILTNSSNTWDPSKLGEIMNFSSEVDLEKISLTNSVSGSLQSNHQSITSLRLLKEMPLFRCFFKNRAVVFICWSQAEI